MLDGLDGTASGDGRAPAPDWLAVETWERFGWGLLDPAQGDVLRKLLPAVEDEGRRRSIAREHLGKCLSRARRLFAALDRPAAAPPSTELHLVAGDAVETLAGIWVDPESGRWRSARAGPGDGTVLRTSALLDEREGGEWRPVLVSPVRWKRVFFFFEDHLGLTRSPGFIDNLLFLLLEEPRAEATLRGE